MTQTHTWEPLRRPELGPLDRISNLICREEWRDQELLTSVRRGPTLLIASDYGGAHRRFAYETLSFLVVDLAFVWLWDEFRRRIRKRLLRDGRRVAFKSLTERHSAGAVIPFLRASNTIPGLLITFCVSKNRTDLLSQPFPTEKQSVLELGDWDRTSFARLTRISALGAMLVACMSAPNQSVLWFTDQDAIAPNIPKLKEATAVTGHFIAHLCPHRLTHVRFGTTECDDGSLQIEDLASLPDLAAGALAELFTSTKRQRGAAATRILLPAPPTISDKARMIAGWLAESFHPLRKLIVTVDEAGEASYNASMVRLIVDAPIPEFDWRFEVNEYLRDKIIAHS